MSGNQVPIKDAFKKIIEAFENEVWMGQLRERWKEIKQLIKVRPLTKAIFVIPS